MMKHCTAGLSLLVVALAAAQPSVADVFDPPGNGCYWEQGLEGPMQIDFNIPPTLHIAQDAPVGTVVGGQEFKGFGAWPAYAVYECVNWGQGLVQATYYAENVPPIANLANGLPRVALPVPEDSIIETNIPGLGVSVRIAGHIDGTSTSQPQFILQKGEARVPFISTRHHPHQTILRVSGHEYFVTLVKTGPIPVGAHTLDPGFEVVRSHISQSAVGGVDTTLNFHLSGNLVSSGCSTAADPVTPNPVNLGEFEARDFEQAGAGSNPVRFNFNLEGCQPPGQGTLPLVHVQLDPVNGSAAIDAANGLFSTGAGSTGGGRGVPGASPGWHTTDATRHPAADHDPAHR
jgi:hypothetical protein